MFLVLFVFVGYVFAKTNELELIVGESKTISVDNPKRVAIGKPEVADFSIISSNEVRVVALSSGVTTLEIWDKDGKLTEYFLRVLSVDVKKLMEKLKVLFGKDIMRLVDMKVVEGGKLMLEGEYDTQDDLRRIQLAIAPYEDQIVNFLKPSKILQETSTYRIYKMIGIDTVEVKLVKNKLLLDGTVPTKEDKERAEKIAKVFYKKVVDTLKVSSSQLIQVNARIYEVDAEFTTDLNLNLIGSGSLETSTDFSYKLLKKPSGGIFTSYLKLGSSLDAAVGEGRAKLLAKPKLVTVNGGKAVFNSGGEKGYQLLSSVGTPSVKWKKYGIRLEIEPLIVRVNESKNIMLHVVAEASELEQLKIPPTIPSVITSNADVKIYMKPDETLLIAGLVKNKKFRVISRFPILGYIPIIDIFFKSVKEEIVEKELLMFITPSIVSPREMIDEYEDLKLRQEEDYQKFKHEQPEVEE